MTPESVLSPVEGLQTPMPAEIGASNQPSADDVGADGDGNPYEGGNGGGTRGSVGGCGGGDGGGRGPGGGGGGLCLPVGGGLSVEACQVEGFAVGDAVKHRIISSRLHGRNAKVTEIR